MKSRRTTIALLMCLFYTGCPSPVDYYRAPQQKEDASEKKVQKAIKQNKQAVHYYKDTQPGDESTQPLQGESVAAPKYSEKASTILVLLEAGILTGPKYFLDVYKVPKKRSDLKKIFQLRSAADKIVEVWNSKIDVDVEVSGKLLYGLKNGIRDMVVDWVKDNPEGTAKFIKAHLPLYEEKLKRERERAKEKIQELLDAGIEIDATGSLHNAVRKRDVESVKFLLSEGAATEATTPVEITQERYYKSTRIETIGGYYTLVDGGHTALHLAVKSSWGTERNEEAEAIIRLLLAEGADVNAKSQDGREHTPLHMASYEVLGKTYGYKRYVPVENFEVIKILVKAGADLSGTPKKLKPERNRTYESVDNIKKEDEEFPVGQYLSFERQSWKGDSSGISERYQKELEPTYGWGWRGG